MRFFFKKPCIFKAFVKNPCFVRLYLCTRGDFYCLFSSLLAIGFGQLGPLGNWNLIIGTLGQLGPLGNWDKIVKIRQLQ